MTPKITITIDQAAISDQIAAALRVTAAKFTAALNSATSEIADLKQSTTVTNKGMSYLFEWESTGDLTAVQIHDGAVMKNGDRVPAKKWTETAQESIDLAAEFREQF